MPFPSLGDLPNPGIEPRSPALQAESLPTELQGKPSFRIDWFDLLAVQGTFKIFSTSLKASILWCSTFFLVQLSHPYMTTGKIIALTIWTFVGKVIALLFNTLSGFVIVPLGS